VIERPGDPHARLRSRAASAVEPATTASEPQAAKPVPNREPAKKPNAPAKKNARSARGPRASRWDVDDYLSYLLSQAAHHVAAGFHVEVRAAGLTVLEWRVLATLSDGRARRVGEIATIALAEQSTVTKLIGRMQAEGHVARSDGDVDRRQSLVRITPDGRRALGSLLAKSKRFERRIVARLDEQEAASLKGTLRKLMRDD
jgi:DNA-binding MarR family transcriptional regulator